MILIRRKLYWKNKLSTLEEFKLLLIFVHHAEFVYYRINTEHRENNKQYINLIVYWLKAYY